MGHREYLRRGVALFGAGAFGLVAATGLTGCEEGYEAETEYETPAGEVERDYEVEQDTGLGEPGLGEPAREPGMGDPIGEPGGLGQQPAGGAPGGQAR